MATIMVDDSENLEKAIKRFKRMVEKEGIIREYKKREYFEKPSAILQPHIPSGARPPPMAPMAPMGAIRSSRPAPAATDWAQLYRRGTSAKKSEADLLMRSYPFLPEYRDVRFNHALFRNESLCVEYRGRV